jgi:ribosomal protein S18 acetylase RimI-like enzyme
MATLQPVLRSFTLADSEQVLAHLKVSAVATYSERFAAYVSDHVRQPPDPVFRLGGPDAKMIVAVVADQVIGTVSFVANEQTSSICNIDVLPAWQRQGLGTRLLAAALLELPSDRNVVLYAMRSSTQAVAFYEKNGFERFEEKDFELGGETIPSVGLILPAARVRSASM